jgi:hypothetical protein
MRKILSGVMGIAMTGAVVTASAFALWSAQATVSGINFSTGSLALEVAPAADGPWASDWDADLTIDNAYPGWQEEAPFFVRFNPGDGVMDVYLQLTAATGWNESALKNYVEVAVLEDETLEPAEEDFMTLAEWDADSHMIIDDLAAGEEGEELLVVARLSEDAPDTVQNKSLTDITFTFTGVQGEEVETEVSPE